MHSMFLPVRHQLLLLGIEKEWLDWGEYIAVTVANVGRLVFVYRDGAKATTMDLDACMSLFTDTLSKDALPVVFMGDFKWCLREPTPLPAAAAVTAGFTSPQLLASMQA